MSEAVIIRTSLEVGFTDASPLPERFKAFRGKVSRAIGALSDYPFEDAQFEVVMMEGGAVNRNSIKEAHRVMKPAGRLYFVVPEKTKTQNDLTMPDIYSIVRYGFDIVEMSRPAWWYFGRRGHTFTICARKKNWREINNSYRPLV